MNVLTLIAITLFGVAYTVPAPNFQALKKDEANLKYFLVETSPGVYEIEDLVHADIDIRVAAEDLSYYFFSRSDPSTGMEIKSSNIEALVGTQFSSLKKTMFVIHGWRSDNGSASNVQVREAVLPKYDVNMFIVDWSLVSKGDYSSAAGSVQEIGKLVADFINSLRVRFGLSLSDVTLVGFSLGAHVSGNAGAALNGRVDLIVGQDPAGPLFFEWNTDNRLDPTDAQFVHVIHTNGGLLGYKPACGHADYYPNGGGISQPGCGLDIAGTCAHSRAFEYYAESVFADTNLFLAHKCTSYWDYTIGRCSDNPTSYLGGYSVDKTASGDYYLDTNSVPPFARG